MPVRRVQVFTAPACRRRLGSGYDPTRRSPQDSSLTSLTCRVLGISRSGLYEAAGRAPSARQVADQALTATIVAIHHGSRATYGAIAMKNALADTMSTLPAQLARSLTWDRGKEMSAHAQFKVETGIPVFFADPHSPWQRGTNENTNGLLRQYFPKGTDLSRWSAEEIEAVAHALNTRPRKTPGWRTPAEALDEHLRLLHQPGVASTG